MTNVMSADFVGAGYLSPVFAAAFDNAALVALSGCQGYLLERAIPQTDHADLAGCYPLFCCQDWSKLGEDLDGLSGRYASVSMVTDPFGRFTEDALRRWFPERMIPFKEHVIVHLQGDWRSGISHHHLRNIKQAEGRVMVECCQEPAPFLDDWVTLYDVLVERHTIQGVAAFSRESFERQFRVPGLVVYRAIHDGETIGMVLWFVQGEVAYYHLGAYSENGYAQKASFAIFHQALESFAAAGVHWVNLGASAGLTRSASNGLSRFKAGWSSLSRTAYFCGRIINRSLYNELVQARGLREGEFFPLYRMGDCR